MGRLSGTSLNTATPYTTALTYKTHPTTGSSSHVLASYRSGSTTTTYQVDANGNITQLSDGTYTFTYEYDDFNQLIRENNPLLNKSITYDYDLGGNLLAVNEYAYTTGDLVNPTSTVVYTYGSAWKDQLTKIGNDDLTYDTNGNLLSYKTRSYSWQAGRQLAQITDTDEDNIFTADYTYNESGIRTRKVVGGVITDVVLEGGKVILETTGSDTLHYSYDSRGQLVSFSLNGTPYFYTRNGQGDITGLIDASGTEVVKYTYDSWGKPISITGSLATTVGAKNPYRYRGYRYDTESGLYYLQSRYYDPSIKRFISADIFLSTGQGFSGNNVYAYCGNQPINRSDSEGTSWQESFSFDWVKIYQIFDAIISFFTGRELFSLVKEKEKNMMIHTENVVKLGMNPEADIRPFIGKISNQGPNYREHCQSAYQLMISYPEGFFQMPVMKNRNWSDLSEEEKNRLTMNMYVWDSEAEKYFRVNYATKAVEIGIDIIY